LETQDTKPIGLVCHAPGVLHHTKREDGSPLVKGKRVTGFSNSEEEAVQLAEVVPFLLEDMLKSNQGLYRKGANWESYIEVDGNLLTGQNPASSKAVAIEMMNKLLNK
jgi:putative intracellular protease/amidase